MPEDEARRIARHQRELFNAQVNSFDVAQPAEVIARLREVVATAALSPGEVILDVGTGIGVLLPLLKPYLPSQVLACDLSEKMLGRLRSKYPHVAAIQADATMLPLGAETIDVVFMNAMFGNIADKAAACRDTAFALRAAGRLVVSHPEGRAFVDTLRASGTLFIESFPTQPEFQALLTPWGMEVMLFRDEPKLYIMVARTKRS